MDMFEFTALSDYFPFKYTHQSAAVYGDYAIFVRIGRGIMGWLDDGNIAGKKEKRVFGEAIRFPVCTYWVENRLNHALSHFSKR